WGWNPRSEASVPDIGDEAYQASHRCAVLRLSPALLREALLSEGTSELAARAAAREFASLVDSLGEERDAEVVSKIESYKGLPPQWQSRLSQLGNRPLVLRDAEDRPLALMQRRRDLRATSDAVTESDESVRASAGRRAGGLSSRCRQGASE